VLYEPFDEDLAVLADASAGSSSANHERARSNDDPEDPEGASTDVREGVRSSAVGSTCRQREPLDRG
jgi:hypothetical protein